MATALITAGVGLVGSFMSYEAQSEATDAARQAQADQLEFQKERYNDWKKVYGVLQEDLGTYYKNLNGHTLAAKEIEKIQVAEQEANKRIQQTMAQRGLASSGLEMGLLNSNTFKGELAKAHISANADELAAQRKMKFLSLGLGQGNSIANSMGNTRTNMAKLELQQGQNAADFYGNATGAIIQGINGYAATNKDTSIGV